MNFSQQQADPRRHVVGFTFVILFHAFVVYALVSGLAKKVVDVVRAPIETKVIDEVKKPPPPETVAPPPPKMEAPPPPFIPPPEVQIAPQPMAQPTITATQTPPPAQPFTTTAAPTQAPAQTAPVSAGVVCSNYTSVMGDVAFPRDATRQGIEKGEAVVAFTVTANGAVKDVRVVSSSHPIFARSSLRIVAEYKCQGQGHDIQVLVPFGYTSQ